MRSVKRCALLVSLGLWSACSTPGPGHQFEAVVGPPGSPSGTGRVETAWWERIAPPPDPPEPPQPGDLPVVVCVIPADLLFDERSSELNPAVHRQLVAMAADLRGALAIAIDGHTDGTPLRGTPEEPDGNIALSEERATAVADDFIQAGIPRHVIETNGRGSGVPLRDEGSGDESQRAEARAANRRVEVRASFPPGSAPPQLCGGSENRR